jgi:hypothetical protein
MAQMICRNCGTVSQPENTDPRGGGIGMAFIVVGSIAFFAVVVSWGLGCGLGCFGLPVSVGCIGLGWWLKNRKPPLRCTTCQTTGNMLPLESPIGHDLARRFHPSPPAAE